MPSDDLKTALAPRRGTLVSLSEQEMSLLQEYATAHDISPDTAAQRLLGERLASLVRRATGERGVSAAVLRFRRG